MTWSWRYLGPDGSTVEPAGVPRGEGFPSQADAETWVGETWQELVDAGVSAVTLLEGEREVYGPMSLELPA